MNHFLKSLLNFLQQCLFVYFLVFLGGVGVGHKARGFLAARPRIVPTPPVLEGGGFLYAILFIYLFGSGGSSLVMVCGSLAWWCLLLCSTALGCIGSVVVAQELSCSTARGPSGTSDRTHVSCNGRETL